MRFVQVILLISALLGCASQTKTIFIPASPLTQEEIEKEKERFSNDPLWDGFDVEEVIGDGKGMMTYRESDIRSAFPSLTENDEQLSLCSNSMMSNATLLVFSSPAESANRKWIKTASCSPAENGLFCRPLELDIKYDYEGVLFDTGLGVEYEEATIIIDLFKRSGIEGLPQFQQRFTHEMINKVQKTTHGFLIGFGEIYCSGCVSDVIIKPVYSEQQTIEKLVFVDAIGSLCI